MGRPSPQTHAKRLREQAKRDKRRAKDERRAERKAAKDAGNGSNDAEPATVFDANAGSESESSAG